MQYISVEKAATQWGITPRQVQRLLAADRIPGAQKLGREWMIPADAAKPGHPRRGEYTQRQSLAADFAQVLAAASIPVPRGHPDAVLASAGGERIRRIHEGSLAYARGDFARTAHCFRQNEGDTAAQLCAAPLMIAAAISLGDYPLYAETETFLKDIVRTSGDAGVSAFAELALAGGYLGAMAPNMVPEWLKAGDFSALPLPARPDAAYKRAKYFQCIGAYPSMLDVAQTALGLVQSAHEISFPATYLGLLCAAACFAMDRLDEAKRWLLDAMRDNLPHGFIAPIAEVMPLFGGLAEQCLRAEYPAQYGAVTALWERAFANWLAFHNRFTKENITLILPLRDYEMALLAARGVPYAEIAKKYGVSPGRLQNIMQEICEKLYISSKKELSQYIL